MADNVDITAGSGTTIATDDCTTGQVQLVKLAYGADGNRTHIPGDGDGLLVNLGTNNDVTVSGTVTANLAAGTNNIGDVDVLSVPAPLSTTGGGTEAAALRVTIANDSTGVVSVDDNGGSITVDAPVGTPVNVQVGDGTNTATVRNLAANDALNVAIVDGAGDQITSFGGGTQYTEADVDASITGTAMMMEGSGNTLVPAQGTTADGLLVNLGANNDVTVTSVTPGTGATDLGKAEDAAHTTGDVGVMTLAVRNDANASLVGTDGDYVPTTADAAGNANVMIRRPLVRVPVQSGGLTTTATAYTAGDQVGNQFTIAGCARASGGGGYITGVQLISAADTIGPFDVVFTDSSVTLAADNAVYAISDADALKIVGLVNLAGAYDIGNNRIAQAFNLMIPYVCSGGTSLYAGLIARSGIAATPFGAATDLQLIVYVELN